MGTFEVSGSGISFRVFEIDDEMAVLLTETGITREAFDQNFILDEEAALYEESGITSDLEVSYDGNDLTDCCPDPEMKELGKNPTVIGSENGYYLVIEEAQQGAWSSLEIDEEFDKSKIAMTTDEYMLPGGSRIRLSNVSYDGDSEFGGTWGNGGDTYVVYPDGKKYDVIYSDEAEEELIRCA